MKRATLSALFALIFCAGALPAIDLRIMPLLQIEDADGNGLTGKQSSAFLWSLMSSISKNDVEGALDARAAGPDAPVAKSDLDMKGWSDRAGVDYAVYGKIWYSKTDIQVELRFYDRMAGGTRKKFYERGESVELGEMGASLGRKIVEYVYAAQKVLISREKTPDRYDITTRMGGWIPVTWPELVGTGRADVSFSITRGDPVALSAGIPIFLRYGADLGYGFMLNSPDHPQAYFNAIRIGIPLSWVYDYGWDQVWVGPRVLCEVDFASIQRRYDDPLTIVAVSPGLNLGLGYQRLLGSSKSIGLGAYFEWSWFPMNDNFMDASIGLDLRFRLKGGKK